MSHAFPLRPVALAACAFLLAFDASAMTLGRARAAVLIGRPLDVSIAATLDSATADVPCADAEVFHGDRRIDRPVSVRWEPGRAGQGVLRVQSSLPVDEPMVTIYLRVGCGQSVTRRYVLLAEPPPDVDELPAPLRLMPDTPPRLAVAPRGAAPADGDVEAVIRPARRAPTDRPSRTTGQARAAARASAPAEATPAPAPVPRKVAPPPSVVRVERPPAATTLKQARARLKLEPLDLTAERDPTLRLSSGLQAQPTEDPKLRQSAAALWDVLRKPPEDALRDSLRLQTLETEMQSLRKLTQQNAAAVVAMKEQAESARSERNQVVMVLLGVLALAAAVGAWMGWGAWSRRSPASSGRWFDPGRKGLDGLEDDDSRAAPLIPPAAPAPKSVAVPEPVPPSKGPLYTPPPPARPSQWGGPDSGGDLGLDFQQSQGGSIRMVGVDELIDIQDKADFFLSLGQHDQAIAILEAHVHDQVETSPLAWLDLLELYHKLGKREPFNQLREEFTDRFAAAVPEFDEFDQPTGGLEQYERALSRIVSLWPSRKVLEVIEESIFRKPGLPGSDTFSLEAYRELILLYHLAKDLAPPRGDDDEAPRASRGGAGGGPGFQNTDLHPLSASEGDLELAPLSPDLLLVPPASSRLGLDIDLDAPAPPPSLDMLDEPTVVLPRRPAAETGNLLEVDFDTGFFDDLMLEDDKDKPAADKKPGA